MRHTLPAVFGEMYLQICRSYSSLPDPRTLTLDEVLFFYDGIREELKQLTGS